MKEDSATNRQTITEYGILLLLFVLGANLFIFIKTAGIHDDGLAYINGIPKPDNSYFRASLGGLVIGVCILAFEEKIFPKIAKGLSFALRRAVWHGSVVLFIVGIILVIYTLMEGLNATNSWGQAFQNARQFISSDLFLSFFIYYYLLSILVSFLGRLRKSFGQHVFYNYLVGKYANPLEEERTFLFLDLNGSTQLAEKLGHVKYSRLLNKCFDDIINALERFSYDIYQFVGDEMVLTWPATEKDDGQAIRMFFAIQEKLQIARGSYKLLFGEIPTFKAAVSTGTVTATLVGGKEKNIAYHGDVLNTTARLLGLCKKYGRNILFTGFYNRLVTKNQKFSTERIATIKLRGKANQSEVFSVSS